MMAAKIMTPKVALLVSNKENMLCVCVFVWQASGAEQRLKQLQEELKCQRQNAESSRLQHQQRSKDLEKQHQRVRQQRGMRETRGDALRNI